MLEAFLAHEAGITLAAPPLAAAAAALLGLKPTTIESRIKKLRLSRPR